MGMRGVGHTADNRQFDNTGYYYRIVPVNSSDQYQTYYTETAKGANSGPIYQAGYILKDYGFVAQDKELNIAPNNGLTGDTWQPSDLTAATSANADYALPFLWRGAGAPDTPIDGIRGQGAVGTQFWNRINSPCSSVIPLDPTTQSAEVLRKPTNDANWYIQGYTEPQAPALELRGEGLSVDNAELKMNG